MQNLQAQNFGCQELSLTDTHDINGGLLDLGFLKIDLMNADGVINLGVAIDPNSVGLPGGGGGIPGVGGLGNLLAPVTGLLNGLLGNLGGVVNPL